MYEGFSNIHQIVISNFLKFGMVKLLKSLHNVVGIDKLLPQIDLKNSSKSTSFYF